MTFTSEAGSEGQQSAGSINSSEQTHGEIDAPKKNEVSLSTITNHMNKVQMEYYQGGHKTGWDPKDVIESIKRDIDFEEPVIRGPVEVAKGDELVLALNYKQLDAVGQILNFRVDEAILKDYFVEVESTGKDPKKVEAMLKYVSVKPQTDDHLVISAGLAKELGVEEQKKDIRILGAYQKVKDIDLDKP